MNFYRRKIQSEVDRFLQYLESIPDVGLRYLAYLSNLNRVADYGDLMEMWQHEGIFKAHEACRQCVNEAAAPLLEGTGLDIAGGESSPEQLPQEMVTKLLDPITSRPTQVLQIGHIEQGFFRSRYILDARVFGWPVGSVKRSYYENNQDAPISGTAIHHYFLSTDLDAYEKIGSSTPEKIGQWNHLLFLLDSILEVPKFPQS